MRRERGFLRIFALIWAVLQLALPTSAMLADASRAAAPPTREHVEDAPGRDCTPAHSPDCAICKHLSVSAPEAPQPSPAFADGEGDGAARGRIPLASRTPAGDALPRAPPARI